MSLWMHRQLLLLDLLTRHTVYGTSPDLSFVKMWGRINKMSLVDLQRQIHMGAELYVGEGKLTHRTCRATAPSVLSLCVNRSVGNSCRAERNRNIRRRLEMFKCRRKRLHVCWTSVVLEDVFFSMPSGEVNPMRTETHCTHVYWQGALPRDYLALVCVSVCVRQSNCALPRTVYERCFLGERQENRDMEKVSARRTKRGQRGERAL